MINKQNGSYCNKPGVCTGASVRAKYGRTSLYRTNDGQW